MLVSSKKNVFYAIIIIIAILVLALSLFSEQNSLVSADEPCQLVKVGQVPKRLLEIQDELIALSGFMIEKYSQLSNHALTMADLAASCDIKKCKTGQCRGQDTLGVGVCPSGQACSDPGGNQDICPKNIKEKLEREAQISEKLTNELLNIGGADIDLGVKLFLLKTEVDLLKQALNESEAKLRNWNPKETFLLSCYEARNQGYVKSCKRETFGLPRVISGLALADEPDSNFDYYICKKKTP